MPGFLATTNIHVDQHISGKLFGLTFDWNVIWSTLLAGAIVVGLSLWVRRGATSGVPSKSQLAYETIIGAIRNQVETSIGPNGAFIVPIAFSLFLFILICNLFEVLPSGTQPEHVPAPTGNVNLTYALAAVVIIWVHGAGIRANGGWRRYWSRLGKPYKVLFPINLIEELAKPITLALRLFGNLFAGALMILLISALIPWLVSWPLEIAWKLFDIFIGFIQAFIFALLTILYFETAMSEGGH
jgi:F-type H+-transporting ATPase subunit a